MNYNKHIFKLDEFLRMLECESGNEAPVDVPFLLKGKMSKQKDFLNYMITQHTVDGIRNQIEKETKEDPKKDHRIKVNFWRKYKDGNVGEFGATIEFPAPNMSIKDDKVILNFGEDLTFKHEDGRDTDEPEITGSIGV